MREAKQRILIADDSAMNRAILTEMLGDGYEILEAENGLQAVSVMQSDENIDLLLLDIMMPEMDGFEVLAMMTGMSLDRRHSRHHDLCRKCVQLCGARLRPRRKRLYQPPV